MDKGGSDQQTVSTSEPWRPLQQPLQRLVSRSESLSRQSPQFFPGQTYVGALPAETQSFQQQMGFADSVFGGAPSPEYGAMVQANANLLGGGGSGDLLSGVSPQALQQLQQQFAGPNIQIGSYGQGLTGGISPTSLNVGAFTPNISPTVNQDPNAAIGRMLSGTPDYSGVAAATRAYADPVLDMLNEDVLPGLMSRGVSLNNTTGETKELNRIVPRVMRDISNQGAMLAEQERQRALGAQERGASLATQAGLTQTGQQLQGFGQGLSGAVSQAGLDQNTQEMLARYGLAGSQLNLSADAARQSALDAYRADTLGLLGTAGGLAGQEANAQAAGVSAFPSTVGMGLMPGQILGDYGQFQRGISEASLQDQINRFNFGQNQPRNDAEWLLSMLTGAGAGSGTSTQTSSVDTNPFLSLLGTAATIGSFIPGPWQPAAVGANAVIP